MLDNRHLKVKMILSPSRNSISEEGFSGKLCILKIFEMLYCESKDYYLLASSAAWAGLKIEEGRDFTFTIAYTEIH